MLRKKPVAEKGVRLSIWLSESDQWMIKTMARLRKQAEDKGIPISQGTVIRIALESYLRVRAETEDFRDSE